MQVSLLLIITVVAAALALWDGIVRVRGRSNSIVSIIQIIAAALMLLALFGIVVTSLGVGILAVILVIVLILQLILRGSTRRKGAAITIIALVLNAIVVIVAFGLFSIPGLS
ncbi:MAG: hypothetical protein BGO97_00330 [Micrococcales bacterium 70-64]|nr:hypothetical protein [Leifsonia sp.]ODU65679.1 MAG: hypothetical protein ABT06_00330 [Leifsonia sp. SCN 70-46]OJX84306.1 MAG: hypothetical protein BGO97_00330 [Micrococcales bacterium 70-64]